MATILLGTEFGGGLGHAVTLRTIADRLTRMGHTPWIALPDITNASAFKPANPSAQEPPVVQAPLWSRPNHMAVSLTGAKPAGVAGLPDTLTLNGATEPRRLAAVLRGWDQLIAWITPDLVLADYAPALLLSTRGRLPRLSIGNGISSPPAGLQPLPRWDATRAPMERDATILQAISTVLQGRNQLPPDCLADVFVGEQQAALLYPPFDPYVLHRRHRALGPLLRPKEPASRDSRGWFAYLSLKTPAIEDLLMGLVASGLPGRVFMADMPATLRDWLIHEGIEVDDLAVPLPEAAKGRRALIHNGSLGMAQYGVAAGLPQLVIPIDAEKRWIASVLGRVGASVDLPLERKPIEAAREAVRTVHDDPRLFEMALERSQAFRHYDIDAGAEIEAMVDALLRPKTAPDLSRKRRTKEAAPSTKAGKCGEPAP